jgi:hypothetical protein
MKIKEHQKGTFVACIAAIVFWTSVGFMSSTGVGLLFFFICLLLFGGLVIAHCIDNDD